MDENPYESPRGIDPQHQKWNWATVGKVVLLIAAILFLIALMLPAVQ